MNVLDGMRMAEERVNLAGEYARLTEILGDILSVKAVRWAMYRVDPECKSDKAAERKWEATPEGIEEMKIKLKLKALEKQIAAAGTLLRAMEMEARNQI